MEPTILLLLAEDEELIRMNLEEELAEAGFELVVAKRGRVGGRPPALSTAQKVEVRRMRDEEGRPVASIAQLFKVSTKAVRRV